MFGRTEPFIRSFMPGPAQPVVRNTHVQKKRPDVRSHNVTAWPSTRLNYEFLGKCKELICRIPHPSRRYSHKGMEYHLSILPWSRGSYVDIRAHFIRPEGAKPTGRGILLHLDVIKVLLPELIAAVRQMEMDDTRDEHLKTKVEVLYGPA